MKKLFFVLPLLLVTACSDTRQAELKEVILEDPNRADLGFSEADNDCITGHMAENLSDEEFEFLIAGKKDKGTSVDINIAKSATMKSMNAIIACGETMKNPSARLKEASEIMKLSSELRGDFE